MAVDHVTVDVCVNLGDSGSNAVLEIFEGLISCRTNTIETYHIRHKRLTGVSPKNHKQIALRSTLFPGSKLQILLEPVD